MGTSRAPPALPAAAASRRGVLFHASKTRILQAERLLEWALRPDDYPRAERVPPGERFATVLYEREVAIGRRDGAAQPALEAGKRANLALAAHAFDGLVLSPGRPLSFWRHLGQMTYARGFRYGLEINAGCLMPALGGGVCLLSNALFELALRLGWRVHERHGHSQEAVPPTAGELWGLDATVAWPYVDLRIAPVLGPARLSVLVRGDLLILRVEGARAGRERITLLALDEALSERAGVFHRSNRIVREVYGARSGKLRARETVALNRRLLLRAPAQARTCLTCGETACARRPHARLAALRIAG